MQRACAWLVVLSVVMMMLVCEGDGYAVGRCGPRETTVPVTGTAHNWARLTGTHRVVVVASQGDGIYARFLSQDLSPLSPSFTLHDASNTANSRSFPLVIADRFTGGFIASWASDTQDNLVGGASFEAVVRAFDKDGSPVSGEFWANAGLEKQYGQYPYSMVQLDDGSVAVAIESWGNEDVLAVFSANLASELTPGGIALPATSSSLPVVSAYGANQILVSPSRSSAFWVYNTDGSLAFSGSSPHSPTYPRFFTSVPHGYVSAYSMGSDLYIQGFSSSLVAATAPQLVTPEIAGDQYTRGVYEVPGGVAVVFSERDTSLLYVVTYAYRTGDSGFEQTSAVDTTLMISDFTGVDGSGVSSFLMPTVGGGDIYLLAYKNTPEMNVCYAEALPVNATTCGMVGEASYTLACVQAILDNATMIATYSTLEIAVGTWTGCPTGGLVMPWPINIRGASRAATVVDCGGSGSFLHLDPTAVGLSGSAYASVVVSRLTVRGASGSLGGAVTVVNADPGPSFSEITVENCQGSRGGGFYAVDSGLRLADTSVDGCTASDSGGGVYIEATSALPSLATVVALLRVTVTGCTAVGGNGGGVALVAETGQMSLVQAEEIRVADCLATSGLGGGLFLSGPMSLELGPTLHVNGSHAQSGGGVYVVDAQSLDVTTLVAAGNRALSTAEDGGGGAVSVRMATHPALLASVWTDAVFVDNEAVSRGGALLARDVSVSLVRPVVRGNGARHGGGITAESLALVARRLDISGGRLVGNVASEDGGALELSGSQCLMAATEVDGNMAGRYGGGMVLRAGATAEVAAGCLFSRNAAFAGGAIFECHGDPDCGTALAACTRDQDHPEGFGAPLVSWEGASEAASAGGGNTASQGPVVASDGVEITVVWPSGFDPLATHAVATGQHPVPGLRVQLADAYGQAVQTGQQVRVQVRPQNDPLVTVSDLHELLPGSTLAGVDVADAAGEAVDGVCGVGASDGGSCALVGLRVFARAELNQTRRARLALAVAVDGAPCVAVPLLPDLEIGDCATGIAGTLIGGRLTCLTQCGAATFLNTSAEHLGYGACVPCPRGTFQASLQHQDEVCRACPAGTYAFEGHTACLPCPSGADCGIGDRVFRRKGFWYPTGSDASEDPPAALFECEVVEACPAGPEYSVCEGAYDAESFLCSHCRSGWAKIGGVCQECWPVWASLVVAVVVAVGMVVVVVYLVRKASAGTPTQSLVMKIGLSYLQMLSLAASFRSQTSRLFRSFSQGASSGAMFSLDFFAFSCLSQHSFFTEVVVMMLLPPLIVLGCRLVYGCLYGRRGGGVSGAIGFVFGRSPAPSLWALYERHTGSLRQATTVIIFLVYPSLVRQILRVFHCSKFDEHAGTRLRADLNQRCYEGAHIVLAGIGAVGSVVYVVGIPLFGALYFARDRRRLGDDVAFQEKHRFLVDGYATRSWWFEFAVMVRKSVVVAVVVFVESVDLQVFVGVLVVLAGLLLQSRRRPFVLPLLNYLDEASLCCVIVTIAAGGALSESSDVSGASQAAIVGLLLAMNGGIMVVFVLLWLRERFRGAHKRARVGPPLEPLSPSSSSSSPSSSSSFSSSPSHTCY